MAKKKTRLEKLKLWLDANPKIKSALNTFSAGFVGVFLLQLKEIEVGNLVEMIQSGAFVGVFFAAVRAGLIAGASAVGWSTTAK